MSGPDTQPRLVPALLSIALLALMPAQPAVAKGYAEGTPILVNGVVTDTAGSPVRDLEVRLLASRTAFSVRRMKREARGATHVAARTDAEGAFELTWRWHDFYNRFEIAAGLEVRAAGSTSWLELARVDVTEWIADGSPVTVPITVENSEAVRSYHEFLASVRSEDQRNLYAEKGRPARIDRLEKSEHVEETWWYFQTGKAYRFEDGKLAGVVDFDPVRSF